MMSKFLGSSYSCRRSYVANLKKGEFLSLIGNQRVGILPPKSKILFSLRISFTWYQKIQDWPSPLGGVRWPKYAECWPVRRKEEEEYRNNAIRAVSFRWNISKTARDIRVPFSLYVIARVTLPTGTTTALWLLSLQRYYSRQHHEFSYFSKRNR